MIGIMTHVCHNLYHHSSWLSWYVDTQNMRHNLYHLFGLSPIGAMLHAMLCAMQDPCFALAMLCAMCYAMLYDLPYVLYAMLCTMCYGLLIAVYHSRLQV